MYNVSVAFANVAQSYMYTVFVGQQNSSCAMSFYQLSKDTVTVLVAVKGSSHIETDRIFVVDKLTIEKLYISMLYQAQDVLSNKLTT